MVSNKAGDAVFFQLKGTSSNDSVGSKGATGLASSGKNTVNTRSLTGLGTEKAYKAAVAAPKARIEKIRLLVISKASNPKKK
jgi:hypothetical protein